MPCFKNRDGETLWYEETGAGTPVVLLHGWCMSSAVWFFQYRHLSSSFRLIAPDLRGHGQSPALSGTLTFEKFAADLADLFIYLDLSGAILTGWSMGGQVALQTYRGLRDRLSGLVLVSSTPCFIARNDFPFGLAGNEAAGMRLKLDRNIRRALEGFHTRMFAAEEFENREDEHQIRRLLASVPAPAREAGLAALYALVQADMRPLLGDIQTSVLILNGDRDLICPPGASSYLAEHISGAEHGIFRECGHVPFLTRHEEFNAEIIRFAERIGGRYV